MVELQAFEGKVEDNVSFILEITLISCWKFFYPQSLVQDFWSVSNRNFWFFLCAVVERPANSLWKKLAMIIANSFVSIGSQTPDLKLRFRSKVSNFKFFKLRNFSITFPDLLSPIPITSHRNERNLPTTFLWIGIKQLASILKSFSIAKHFALFCFLCSLSRESKISPLY